VYSQEVYIDPELIDFDKIREEEQLNEKSKIERVYIFLAIKDGSEFKAYATRGDSDLDNDGKTALQEPNDLAEYVNLVSFERSIEIKGDTHVCYITDLPHFDKLFPKHDDPFDGNGIIELLAKVKEDDKSRLLGSVTFPLIGEDGSTSGIERFTVFYNKSITEVKEQPKKEEGKKAAGKEAEEKEKKTTVQLKIGDNIVSYGFIEILMTDA